MEYLFPHSSSNVFVREKKRASDLTCLEVDDWDEYDKRCGSFEVPSPTTKSDWLGLYSDSPGPWTRELHGHESFQLYFENREDLMLAQMRAAGRDEELPLYVASLVQYMLTIGLLKALLSRRVRVSYITRSCADGGRRLYTRNLTFVLVAWMENIIGWRTTARHWGAESLPRWTKRVLGLDDRSPLLGPSALMSVREKCAGVIYILINFGFEDEFFEGWCNESDASILQDILVEVLPHTL